MFESISCAVKFTIEATSGQTHDMDTNSGQMTWTQPADKGRGHNQRTKDVDTTSGQTHDVNTTSEETHDVDTNSGQKTWTQPADK